MPPKASVAQPSAGLPYARGKKSPIYLHKDRSADYKKALQVRSQSSGKLLSTPAKASSRPDSGVGKIHRPDTEEHLATALAGRRWDSSDLVEHTFGGIVTVPLAARILLALLRHQLIEVITEPGDEGHNLPQPQLWVEACVDAAQRLDLRLRNRGAPKRSSYGWRWTAFDAVGTEGDGRASEFFNTVGALSYAIAGRIDSQFHSKYAYRNRFIFLEKGASFCGWEEQGCRPDIISLPTDAFQSSDPALDTLVAADTPSKILGQLLRSDPARPPVTAEAESSDSSSEQEQGPWEALRRELEEALGTTSDIDDYVLPPASLHNAVDMRRINWAGLTVTGELKSQPTANSVRQDFIYMEMQRLSQPYLRSVLGLGLTPADITLIRADGMGTEECRLIKKAGWGVLEIIRLALGLAVANRKQLGAHPFFELDELPTDVDLFFFPPNPKVHVEPPKTVVSMAAASSIQTETTTDAPSSVGSKRKADDQPESSVIPEKRVKSQKNEWKACQASFVTIPNPGDPDNGTRYYLDHLADNRGGLVGRSTRVWCAYQELRDRALIQELVRPEDISRALETLDAGDRVFVGPFALKIQNVDMTSASYQQDICSVLKEKAAEDPEGSKFILLPERSWKSGNILEVVRGLTEDTVPAGVANNLVNRCEIICVSLFKRTIGHCQSIGEFGRAIANILQAILWLQKQGVVHRDISRGNVLLAREEPTAFTEPRQVLANGKSILLCRRWPSQSPNVYGVLHDLDMAYFVPESNDAPESTPDQEGSQGKKHGGGSRMLSAVKQHQMESRQLKNANHVKFRVGTPPYMAIDLLLDRVEGHHTAHYDVESVFYVLYLYPFDALPPPEVPIYPNALKRPSIAFPHTILAWVKGTDLRTLGSAKAAFFEKDIGDWTKTVQTSYNLKRLWNYDGEDYDRNFDYWGEMVYAFHDRIWDGKFRMPTHQMNLEGITEEILRLSADVPL